MIDKDQTVIFSLNGNNGSPEHLGAFEDFNPVEERPAALSTALVSLGYLRGALRRTMVFWCVMAIVGLIIGVGIDVKFPPAFKASTSVLITYGPDENPSGAVLDNQAIAESRTVAEMAMSKLGVHESVSAFAAATTVTVVTERVLEITVSAPSAADAVSRANAVASSFLQLRTNQVEAAQKLLLQSLGQELSQATKNVATINAEIKSTEAQLATTAQAKKLKSLQSQLATAQNQVSVDQQTIQETTVDTGTLSAAKASTVLDPAMAITHSKLKYLLIYAVTGLIGGLAVGMGLVVVQTIVSDRLRRRDDVAHALGAPVRLSVGVVRSGRLWGARGGAGKASIRRITAHLQAALPRTVRGVPALAVVPIDDTEAAALAVVSLATVRAREGRKVVLADLAEGAPAAALLRAKGAGVRMVSAGDARLTLAVPDRYDLAPTGPVGQAPAEVAYPEFTDAVREASAAADLLITLVTLDPSVGAEHVPTWAASAVAVVTAGRSSWAKVHAVGEMIRLADVSLVSAVLVGADRTDESMGVSEQSTALSRPAELA